jgi:hypothetical protein
MRKTEDQTQHAGRAAQGPLHITIASTIPLFVGEVRTGMRIVGLPGVWAVRVRLQLPHRVLLLGAAGVRPVWLLARHDRPVMVTDESAQRAGLMVGVR